MWISPRIPCKSRFRGTGRDRDRGEGGKTGKFRPQIRAGRAFTIPRSKVNHQRPADSKFLCPPFLPALGRRAGMGGRAGGRGEEWGKGEREGELDEREKRGWANECRPITPGHQHRKYKNSPSPLPPPPPGGGWGGRIFILPVLVVLFKRGSVPAILGTRSNEHCYSRSADRPFRRGWR